MTRKLEAFEDPDDPRNGSQYHSGISCIERDCDEPAGTWWSRLWCFKHNVQRIKRIDAKFDPLRKAIDPESTR